MKATVLIGAILGMLTGLGFADYHNQHVSVLGAPDQFYFKPVGYLLIAIAGTLVGMLVGALIGQTRHTRR